jgi:hypothetical protein
LQNGVVVKQCTSHFTNPDALVIALFFPFVTLMDDQQAREKRKSSAVMNDNTIREKPLLLLFGQVKHSLPSWLHFVDERKRKKFDRRKNETPVDNDRALFCFACLHCEDQRK